MNRFTQTPKAYAALPTRHPVTLLPASLLPYRKTWQPLMGSLPKDSYLIVTSLDRKQNNISIRGLVHSLRRQGQLVYVLSLG